METLDALPFLEYHGHSPITELIYSYTASCSFCAVYQRTHFIHAKLTMRGRNRFGIIQTRAIGIEVFLRTEPTLRDSCSNLQL